MRAQRIDCATLSDALDRLGIDGQCRSIQACDPGFSLAGRAFTILYESAGSQPGTVGDYIDDIPVGFIAALDNAARTDVTVWGDILTEVAHRRLLGGTAINGICRDVRLCRALNYPVFSVGQWMRTGKDRVQMKAVEVPILMGGVTILPGDILCGDPDGLIVIPKAEENAVLDAAEQIAAAEEKIREAVRAGVALKEARAQLKYHSLQSRRGGDGA
jgi:4-hydroxy-4-methyl-2-oxoglutarate aldolase